MEDKVRRSIMIALLALLALVVAAPTALAQGGPPEDFNLDVVVPAKDPTVEGSLGCDFALRGVITGKSKTIELPNGGFIVTAPGQNVTVTNVDTGEEATFNITGSTFASAPDKDGIVSYVITGRNLAFDPAGVFLNIGRFTFALDQSDPENPTVFEQQEGKGQAIDVCELLS
jgi:hypothetical protein